MNTLWFVSVYWRNFPARTIIVFVLITSPAGYGKTTLISQWAAGKNDLGWFSLDEGDNQQERFASYLIAAIQQATGNHCAASEAMVQKRQYASLSSLFAQLFIELADWQRPLYLVIDDYHLINNPVIHDAMRFFLRHQPENMTLVVLSRNLPQLGIANLRVRDQLLEIGSQQLAFTHQEAKQFFDCRLTSPIEADDSSRLCDDVAGWATALQLIALSARRITLPPNTPPAASPGLTPAICRIIWWMKYWITSTPARVTFC
ncbi:transcriptional regulator MalT [Klebsiella aerogenes]|nr:transcriptional regulator MalT [Klebsiella aerogenes]